MNNSILHIFNKEKNCLGTGFVIDADQDGIFVVTCGHVVNKCKNDILVEGLDAEIQQNHYENNLDLAILYVKGLSKKPLFISTEQSSETVKVIGYSKFQGVPKREPIDNIKIKYDIKISKQKINIEAIKLYPDEPISGGYSGSPVICETTNKVIGIVNLQVGNDTNYAISAKHILDIYQIKGSVNIPSTFSPKKGLTTDLKVEEYIVIKKQFDQNLAEALESFSTQPQIWIEPLLHTINEDSNFSSNTETKINIKDIYQHLNV